MEDPRTYFAAERTLLAWVRTGLTVVGLGFVVARFGLFLRVLRNEQGGSSPGSTIIGVGLVLVGSIGIAVAAVQHVRFLRATGADKPRESYWIWWSVWFAAALSCVGVVLAIYITLRSNTVP